MGWSIGQEDGRDIGYGVPAVCDYPRCNTQIDRGLAFRCGELKVDWACGLYFCYDHLFYGEDEYGDGAQCCDRCLHNLSLGDHWRQYWPAYEPKRDIKTWRHWKLTDESWAEWRNNNPEKVAQL